MRPVIILAAVAAVSLAACGKKEVSSGGATVTSTPGSQTFKTKEGVATVASGAGAAASAQANLPPFAPLYPGASVEATISGGGSGGDGVGGTVVMHTADSPDKVMAFYKAKAAAAGLTTTMDADMGGAKQYVAGEEGGKRTLQVIVAPEANGSAVQLFWGAAKS